MAPERPARARNIVLCSDGTGNAPAKRGEGTNVWKIFRAVELHQENDEKREQLAFYDDGVGTGNLRLIKALGGAFGWGLTRNIRDLYSNLVHHYEPDTEEGEPDRIFLFGFSRGAFTVRSLAGLICACGIVDKRKYSGELLREKIALAVDTYRRAHRKVDPSIAARFREDHSVTLSASCPGCVDPHDIPIKCVGVWDTVDAVGLPVDELTDAFDKLFKFRFHRYGLHPCVENGFHALAIDDQRHTFHPVMWDESKREPHQHIEQVWFAGMHSNVGGGYPKDQMALVALDWMMEKADACGLKFRRSLWAEWREEASVHGTLYDSRSGFSAYYRYRPRNIHQLSLESQSLPEDGPGPLIHHTVFDRIAKATADYAPPNVPKKHRKVTPDGVVECELKKDAWKALDIVWDMIWLRRVLYFAFVALSITLVVKGYQFSRPDIETCRVGIPALDPIFDLAAWAAPAALEGGIAGLRLHTFWLLFFIVGGLFLAWCKKRLVRSTINASIASWRLEGELPVTSVPRESWIHRVANKIRWSKASARSRRFKSNVLPWITLALAVVLLAAGLWRWLSPATFDAAKTSAKARLGIDVTEPVLECGDSSVARPLAPGESITVPFKTKCGCQASAILLEKGVAYHYEVSADEVWIDKTLEAGPGGLDGAPPAGTRPSRLFLRSWSEPWFRLLGNIGAGARYQFAIGKGGDLEAEESGRLYLYVNDAVTYWSPSGPWGYYEKNEGAARVTVTRAREGE